MTIASLLLHKLWTCDVEELCCCEELTAAHVCFVQTADHLSALFMAVVDSQFFTSLLCYVQDFSRISEKNVGSQPNFSHILLIAIIWQSWISAEISFPPSGIFKKFGFGSIKYCSPFPHTIPPVFDILSFQPFKIPLPFAKYCDCSYSKISYRKICINKYNNYFILHIVLWWCLYIYFNMDCANVLLRCMWRHQKSWMFCVQCQLPFAVQIIQLLNCTWVKVEILMASMAWHYLVRIFRGFHG